jgi:hypothetical protein
MARKTATTESPARAPRKANRAFQGNHNKASAWQKPTTGRQTAKTARPARPNPFDDIARQVIAEQEARDRAAGREDLTPTVAMSLDPATAKRSGTSRTATKPTTPARPAKPTAPTKPARPTKVQGNRTIFKGRPTSNPETIAARAKQLGLRVRTDANIDAIAARLRATPDAVSAWLATRNAAPATTTARSLTKAPAKPTTAKAPSVDLQQNWEGPVPKDIPELKGASLVVRYEVRPDDGTVWATLQQVVGPDGKVMPDFWRLPLDYRPKRETLGNGRKLVLKDRTIAGLQTWLVKQGLTTPEDITDYRGFHNGGK